jgi:hypothetical protein
VCRFECERIFVLSLFQAYLDNEGSIQELELGTTEKTQTPKLFVTAASSLLKSVACGNPKLTLGRS